ncbi:pyrroloquinoline quinone precursor peptide PqqA [Actinomadura fulvescens]
MNAPEVIPDENGPGAWLTPAFEIVDTSLEVTAYFLATR